MNVTLIGIDLAKTIFQVCGVNQAGKEIFNRQLRRKKLLEFLAQYPDVTIAMEACSGSNYWGRTLASKGHEMRFVRPKTLAQTDMMLAHRIRSRQVSERNALTNQIRGLLNEYGIVVNQGKSQLRTSLPLLLEDADNKLTMTSRQYFQELLNEWILLDKTIHQLERSLVKQAKECTKAKRLMGIKGVAEITATAAVMYAGDGSSYKNGRCFSASIGLVPKEHSSGGRQRLGSITKRINYQPGPRK